MDVARVVVADEQPLLREGLRNLLRHEPDLEVVGEAGDAPETLRLVETLRPDLVVMDVDLPGLDGAETARLIKAASPGTAVVVLSTSADEHQIVTLLAAGVSGYLLKCATVHEVVQSLRAVRAGESVLHPAVANLVLARASRPRFGAPGAAGADSVTAREAEVLRHAAQGKSNKEIASDLCLSISTVKSHLVSIFSKLGVACRTEAVLEALRRGLVAVDARSKLLERSGTGTGLADAASGGRHRPPSSARLGRLR